MWSIPTIWVRDAVRADPALFVRGEAPVLIDEFQHAPELLGAIKAELNRDGAAGRFVFTGSTRYATLPAAAQTLTGRAHRMDVPPQGEIAEVREDFAEALVSDPRSLLDASPPALAREEYVSRVVAGGFPPALRRARSADRARWFDDYVDLVIERDVLELTRVRQRRQLPLLRRALHRRKGIHARGNAHRAAQPALERTRGSLTVGHRLRLAVMALPGMAAARVSPRAILQE